MRTTKRIIETLEVECIPEDKQEAVDFLRENGYRLASYVTKWFYNKPVMYVKGERPHAPEPDKCKYAEPKIYCHLSDSHGESDFCKQCDQKKIEVNK